MLSTSNPRQAIGLTVGAAGAADSLAYIPPAQAGATAAGPQKDTRPNSDTLPEISVTGRKARGKSSSGIELPVNRLIRWSMCRIAAGLGASLISLAAMAADTTAPAPATDLVEIVVTGSSIAQRLDSSSLPVTLIGSEEIAKTGYTSTTDLLQNLPAMQGFVPASSSVNGGGAGITTAAVHSLPSKYTLVLVDGQRMAGFELAAVSGEGFGVNLNSIPLDAVERVEVLTDGASALYGADAIAGVVNFVLKKDQTEGSAYYNASIPSQSGGGSWNAGMSKGFGSLSDDGWNILLTFSHNALSPVRAPFFHSRPMERTTYSTIGLPTPSPRTLLLARWEHRTIRIIRPMVIAARARWQRHSPRAATRLAASIMRRPSKTSLHRNEIADY